MTPCSHSENTHVRLYLALAVEFLIIHPTWPILPHAHFKPSTYFVPRLSRQGIGHRVGELYITANLWLTNKRFFEFSGHV